jgi:hypothetical protein
VCVDPDDLAKPRGGVLVAYIDHWWLTNSRGQIAFYRWGKPHPGRRLAASPQANQDRRISELLRGNGMHGPLLVPAVFLPYDPDRGAYLPDDVELFDAAGHKITNEGMS